MKLNKYVFIKNKENYYEHIYNYLYLKNYILKKMEKLIRIKYYILKICLKLTILNPSKIKKVKNLEF